jgi:hypothetical protein
MMTFANRYICYLIIIILIINVADTLLYKNFINHRMSSQQSKTRRSFSQSLKPSGFEQTYKMTFRRQEKTRKMILSGQSHLRNP